MPFSHVSTPRQLLHLLTSVAANSNDASAPLVFSDCTPPPIRALISSMCVIAADKRPSAADVYKTLQDLCQIGSNDDVVIPRTEVTLVGNDDLSVATSAYEDLNTTSDFLVECDAIDES